MMNIDGKTELPQATTFQQVEKPATSVENLPVVGSIDQTPMLKYEKPSEVVIPVSSGAESITETPTPDYSVTVGYPLSQNSVNDVPALQIVLEHIKNEIPVD